MSDSTAFRAPTRVPITSLAPVARAFSTLWLFVKRDALIDLSYKLQFAFRILSVLLTITSFYFVSKLVGPGIADTHLKAYGADYFSFVLIGIGFSNFLDAGMVRLTQNMRNAMSQGALEVMFASPTRASAMIVLSSFWELGFELCRLLLLLALGVLLFGARLSNPNYLGAALVLALTIVCFTGMGLVTASLVMLFKRGDPINWTLSSVSALLGGALFPITLLPEWLSWASYVLPITYSLHAFRVLLLQGGSVAEVSTQVVSLAAFALVMLPLSLWTCEKVTQRVKRGGSLSWY